ncbi:energy-coupling factor transporter ATP-binding protein EcfA2 [Microbacterium trichothecenolyticum]|uniref:ATP-dependent nuclease n=1 Tax=Microbacterium trichothecenolyticum TaxID=69370 RepID=UPI00285F09D0|nr:AAA family ATPase [Microbacterium trichothecenolyticum]MDR7187179.1 energy-coupling factor transporter ATP-binding protein EcfA2 [Microbacterium trichothecenolyticum]
MASNESSGTTASGLRQLRLIRFRSFEDFTLTFGDGALLVGPNNAGKSTLLTAIRFADTLIRHAHRRTPTSSTVDLDLRVLTYPIQMRDFPALRDSVRYEFGTAESRLELTWKSGARLVVVWPDESEAEDSPDPFFYLTQPGGAPVRTTQIARMHFPALGIVPVLTPVEQHEGLRDDAYVRQNMASRLSSRHFRNQLRLLQKSGDLQEFLDWASPWMGDLELDRVQTQVGDDGPVVTVYTYERGSRVPKELVWAGDGVQVWLQLLLQIYRVRDREVIILDEPEVYLHADLQRRLMRLLESIGAQIILASHSTELIAEADGRSTTLIDRTRRRAIRPRSDAQFETLSSMLGTAFNLRLAKALRSRVAVFVEGRDMAVLRQIARRLSLRALEREEGVTVIPLNGYTGWRNVEPFRWLTEEILPNALRTFVILDRDYRSDSERERVMESLRSVGVGGHVWQRKELESYLLSPSLLARVAGCPEEQITAWLNEITLGMETDVFSRQLQERLSHDVAAHHHAVDVTSSFKHSFDADWRDAAMRLNACPAKQVLSALNQRLQGSGCKPASVAGLARSIRVSEIPSEMSELLTVIDSAATS